MAQNVPATPDRPNTPAQIAAALHTIADQIAAMPNPDQPRGGQYGPAVTLQIQPNGADEVDEFADALGASTRSEKVGPGWQHTTRPLNRHPSGVEVSVFCGVDDPEVTALRAELAAYRAAAQVPAEVVEAAERVFPEGRLPVIHFDNGGQR